MKRRLAPTVLAMTLALCAAGSAWSQARPGSNETLLPILNQTSGKLEGVLVLEPTSTPATGARWKVGRTTLDAAFGLGGSNTLGLVCDRATGLSNAIGSLVNNCLLAALDDETRSSASRPVAASAAVSRNGLRAGVGASTGRESLPGWLNPAGRSGKVDSNALTVFGQANVGREATVSIGGTVARARFVPAGDIPDAMADRWNIKSVSVGAGYGPFSANVIGRVVDSPSQPGQWEGLGLGLTWRTPWSGQLTVGADNVVTRGKNPFSPGNLDKEEGTVPYVRYEQDL